MGHHRPPQFYRLPSAHAPTSALDLDAAVRSLALPPTPTHLLHTMPPAAGAVRGRQAPKRKNDDAPYATSGVKRGGANGDSGERVKRRKMDHGSSGLGNVYPRSGSHDSDEGLLIQVSNAATTPSAPRATLMAFCMHSSTSPSCL